MIVSIGNSLATLVSDDSHLLVVITMRTSINTFSIVMTFKWNRITCLSVGISGCQILHMQQSNNYAVVLSPSQVKHQISEKKCSL